MAYGELILGWLMGMLSPAIVTAFGRRRRHTELKRVIGVELRELQYTLALVTLRLFRRSKAMTPERLKMLKDVVLAYDGPDEDLEGLVATKQYFSLSEAQQLSIAAQAQETGFNAPRPVKYYLPFIEAHTAELRELSVDLQARITQIIRDLHIFNDAVDYSTKQFDLTFDTSIAGNNRILLLRNIENTYAMLAIRGERIVREVLETLARHKL